MLKFLIINNIGNKKISNRQKNSYIILILVGFTIISDYKVSNFYNL